MVTCTIRYGPGVVSFHVLRAMPLGRAEDVPLVVVVVVRLTGMPPDPLVDGEMPLRVAVVDVKERTLNCRLL